LTKSPVSPETGDFLNADEQNVPRRLSLTVVGFPMKIASRFAARNYYGCAHHDQRKTPCVGVGVLDDPSGKFDLDGQIFPLSAAAGSGGCRGRHPLHEIIFHNNDILFVCGPVSLLLSLVFAAAGWSGPPSIM